MTNYNERLDEVLDDFFTIGTERHISELKQAITSLIKGNRYHMKGHEIKSLGNIEKLKSGKTVYAVRMDVLEKFKEVV